MSATIKNAISTGVAKLKAAGVADPRNDANLLAMHVIKRDRTFLLTHGEATLSPDQLNLYRSLIERRGSGEPLQYITGHQEFFKLDFETSPDVLIPRPETELIVEIGMELLKDKARPFIADIGTGSGCIVISLLHELRQSRAVATDVSSAALAVATRNANRYQVSDRLRLIESDLFSALESNELFDLIVSNPPYVPAADLEGLQREVSREPQNALDGGADGLAVIRRLLNEAPVFLRARGYLVFEIGFDQAESVKRIIDSAAWELIDVRRDLQGIPRTVVLRKSN
ncbi:MAG TPA: peptide chain release factor N(5)-glutamine methyltransferase [Pyrinomonadaceae bacterium]|nr:peptide chain release factor N(5)-glutamine methyltransferase [Pyrinomonadaceae bacterium]